MQLIQLIYVSSTPSLLDEASLTAILASSRRHNLQNRITGMLLYADGSFLQVLEGDADTVEETMARISQDPRHHQIIELSKGPIAAREFGQWTMGFRALSPADAAAHPGYAPYFTRGFNPRQVGDTPGLALELLTAFASRSVP